MSRCFPFPPPGYEKEHRPEDLDLLKEVCSLVPEDLDLLKEVKRKEKKHKKEKKDKERKKDKEKKKKDGSDEKHREKKDRKEKHKDKKERHKDKKKEKENRGKDKEKSSISEESTVAGKLDNRTAGKVQPKVQSNDKSSSSNEGKYDGKPSQSSLPSQVNDESKFVRELDRRIRDEEKGTGRQLPEKAAFLDKKDQEMIARAAIRNSSGLMAEQNVDNRNKKIERKLDPQGVGNEFSGNMMVQNLMPMMKGKVEGIPKTADERNGRRMEDKERYRETLGVKLGNKKKHRDKGSQVKEKDKEKEKKKDDKAKMKSENKQSSQNQLKDDGRNDLGGFTGNKTFNLLKDTHSNSASEGNIKKRKEMHSNGFLHESDIRPNKMLRPAPHQLTENGRKLEPSQTPTKSPHEKHAVLNSLQVDSKDRLLNGIIDAQKPSPSKPKPFPITDQNAEASKKPQNDAHHMKKSFKVPKIEDLIAEASRRLPHPDSKYLMDVLTIPKVEDCPGDDDQEWLFSEIGYTSKPGVGPSGIEEDPRVWSEAVQIESADVCALPYVIPY